MKVKEFIYKESRKRKLHFTLLDPDPKKMAYIEDKAKQLEKSDTDAIMIGGSTNINQKNLDETIKTIKNHCSKPAILFPSDVSGISKYADAIFFMSLLNSKDPYFITGAQSKGALIVKELGLEPIPMAYLIVEPGMKAGQVGKVNLIKRNDSKKAVEYSVAAQMMGFSLVYLEAGSGADNPIHAEMISAVKKSIDIPLLVGGGIRNSSQASAAAKAGADIVVTGTIAEENFDKLGDIIKAVKGVKK